MKTFNHIPVAIMFFMMVVLYSFDLNGQQTVNCYPQSANYCTGSCTASSKTDVSMVNSIGGGGKRGWMKFDVSNIPDNVTIASVKINYYVNNITNNPYYRFTKLNLDPVSSGASAVYSAIGQASSGSSTNTYYEYSSSGLSNGIKYADLNFNAVADLAAALQQDYFCVGLFAYQNSNTNSIRLYGWNQSPKPYLEVTYIPNNANDIGIDELVSPVSPACEGYQPIQVKLHNYGADTVTSAVINWSINGISQAPYNYSGSLAPGAVEQIILVKYLLTPGNLSLYVQSSLPNGYSDQNSSNDSKNVIVQVISKPGISSQPASQTTTLGGNANFSVLGTGVGLTYQWQLSTDNGLSYANINSLPPYSGTHANILTITGASQGMTGYLYRCRVSGTCPPDVISDSARLIVGDPIEAKAGIGYVCQGNIATLPVILKNMLNITSFKLSLSYNITGITYLNASDINPALSIGTWSAIESGGVITLEWSSVTPLSLSNDTICKLHFTYNNGDNPISFASESPDACYFLTPSGIHYPVNFINGAVSNADVTILTNPFNVLTGIYSTAIFTVTSSGAPAYQWQVSNNSGATWADIVNSSTYSGANTNQLNISNCALAMNNYQYRCVLTACTISVNSQAALLNVVKIVKTSVGNYTPFVDDTLIVPIRVWNFDSINAVSLELEFDKSVLCYIGYQNLYQSVNTMFINVDSTPELPNPSSVYLGFFEFVSSASIPDSGIMVELLFKYLGGSTNLTWDTINSSYGDPNASLLPTVFQNGSVTPFVGSTIEGYLTYKNISSSPLSGCQVVLTVNNINQTQITDINGHYEFNHLVNGTYYLTPASDKPWGGANATDALIVLKHYTGMTALTGMEKIAADVDENGLINSVDALLIIRRFVSLITSFTAGDWLAGQDTVVITGISAMTANLKAICYGDVNGSYILALKSEPGIKLVREGKLNLSSFNDVELPVIVDQAVNVGAISIVMQVDRAIASLQKIILNGNGELLYNVTGDELRISWYSLIPMQLDPGDVLFTMILNINRDALTGMGSDWLSINPESQIGDGNAMPVALVSLKYPELSIQEGTAWLGQNVPNPFSDESEISYSLPDAANVTLEVFDIYGREVIELENSWQEAGNFTSTLAGTQLLPGIYTYRLVVTANGDVFVQSRRMVVSR